MGKPAAREGDLHECPMVDPVNDILHLGGVIIGPGNGTVLIGGKPAATVGDTCKCIIGEPGIITGGSTGVFIGGKPVARVGDGCAHGGKVSSGWGSVLIGERGMKGFLSSQNNLTEEDDLPGEPTQEEKNRQINTAIKKCKVLLERKLRLLECGEKNTMEAFGKWFGRVNECEVQTIIHRIENALNVARELKVENFKVIVDEHTRMYSSAMVWSNDEFHTIFLGDLFWNEEHLKEHSQESILVHELSHFDYVGMTNDFDYGIKQCLDLAKNNHKKALFNADGFERFIKS